MGGTSATKLKEIKDADIQKFKDKVKENEYAKHQIMIKMRPNN